MPLPAGHLPARKFAGSLTFLSLACCTAFAQSEFRAEVSFHNDVMAVLSKAGCNAGACHGNKNGKGGFKLSLRGQNPELDYLTLSRDIFARRTNPLEAGQSLILLKPTTDVPHEGGLRFRKESEEYKILHRWLAADMPRDTETTPTLEKIEPSPTEQVLVEPIDQVQIKVRATFSDGSQRDVTRLAVFEPANTLATVS